MNPDGRESFRFTYRTRADTRYARRGRRKCNSLHLVDSGRGSGITAGKTSLEWLKKARKTIAVARERSPDDLGEAKGLRDVTFVTWVVYHSKHKAKCSPVSVLEVKVADLLQWNPDVADGPLPACSTYEKPHPLKRKACDLGGRPPANADSKRQRLEDLFKEMEGNRNKRKGEDFQRRGVRALPFNPKLALILEGSDHSTAMERMRQRRPPASERVQDGWRGIQQSGESNHHFEHFLKVDSALWTCSEHSETRLRLQSEV